VTTIGWRVTFRQPISRRAFLRRSGLVALGGVLAACTGPTASPSQQPSASATASPPTPTPTPHEPTASPEPLPDLRARIAQMLLVGFRGLTADEAPKTLRAVGALGLGGVLLFDRDLPSGSNVRNIASAEQVRALVADLQAAAVAGPATVPLLVALDQEGGLVERLTAARGFVESPSAAELGAADDADATRQATRALAAQLATVGVNLDLAPVVDLNVNPENPIIGALDRSFGADPSLIVRQATAFIEGLHDERILSAIKHFPGHGSSTGDTHLGVVDVTETWREVELEPFRDLVAAGLPDAVLTAHVFNASLDPDYPATLSRATIDGLLRGRLGWDGVVISDDLQMGAIRDEFGYEEAMRLAIEAGVDVLTIANQQVYEEGIVERTIDLVEGFVADGRMDEGRISASWRRIARLKASLAPA
jgi:beta-N-acetylhexosaminidase